MLAAGLVCLAAVLLPWANARTGDAVNFSLIRPEGIRGVMATQWGPPVLAAAAAAVAAAVTMLILGPRLLTMVLSLTGVIAGVVLVMQATSAADSMSGLVRPGIGLYVTLLTGILLVPIGIASSMVAHILRGRRDAA